MGGLTQPAPLTEERSSVPRAILLGIIAVAIIVGVIALLLHTGPKSAPPPHPYASNVKITDLKMSAAENFVGASVTYIDGTVTNSGDKTVIHAMIHTTFRNSMNESAQIEDIPLRVLQASGPYPDAVDLAVSPLTPGQSKPFRLTFEHVTADWNQNYPELQVTDVKLK